MRGLKKLLRQKIAITALFWCAPLLLFPRAWFVALGVPAPEPLVLARLLGVAYLALLVGYRGGLRMIDKGEYPLHVVHMGIASNGLAAALLVACGATGAWCTWSPGAAAFMWLSTAGALSITIRLIRQRMRAPQ